MVSSFKREYDKIILVIKNKKIKELPVFSKIDFQD